MPVHANFGLGNKYINEPVTTEIINCAAAIVAQQKSFLFTESFFYIIF